MCRFAPSLFALSLFALVLVLVMAAGTPARADDSLLLARDVAYAAAEPEGRLLDIYGTADGTDRPVMIFAHGGGWMRGDKSRTWKKPQAFADAGWLFVTINYQMEEGRADPDAQAGDVAAAVLWAHENIAAYGGNPDKLFLMGHSAGAHLVALAALAPEYKLTDGLVDGVVALDTAAYDIDFHMENFARGRNLELYERVFGKDKAFRDQVSPTIRAGDGATPPFLIYYINGRPATEFQSNRLAAALRAAGGRAEAIGADHTHASINREFGTPGETVTVRTFEWLADLAAPAGTGD